jgi:hypothetical protein
MLHARRRDVPTQPMLPLDLLDHADRAGDKLQQPATKDS